MLDTHTIVGCAVRALCIQIVPNVKARPTADAFDR